MLLKAFWWLSGRLSPARASRFGRRLLETLGPRSRKHRHVLANLRMLCPERDEAEITALARAVWGNLGASLAEFPHFAAIIDPDCEFASLEVVCENRDPDFLARKRPCVFVAPHLGNWELSGYAIHSLGYPVDLVYNPQVNPGLERLVAARRTALGQTLIPKENALRRLIASLKQGRSVGLHVDVRIDDGLSVPFAGAPAATTPLPAWLARRFDCAIVPVHTERLGDARFRSVIHPAVHAPGEAHKSLEEITAAMNRAIADLIRARPGQWQCTKRRWPKEIMKVRGAYRAPGDTDERSEE